MPTIGTIPTQPGELVRALLTVGEAGPNTSNRNWYRESTAVGSFSDDSDIEMSAGLGNINRVLWNLNNELRVFRSGSGSLITAIAAAGDLAGKSFFFATGDDAIDARFDVGADDVTAAAGRIQLVSDATVQAVFNAVVSGGLVNIVIADTPGAPIAPIIETGGVDVEAGAPGVEATAEAVRGAPVDHNTAAGVELGAPGITADAEAGPGSGSDRRERRRRGGSSRGRGDGARGAGAQCDEPSDVPDAGRCLDATTGARGCDAHPGNRRRSGRGSSPGDLPRDL